MGRYQYMRKTKHEFLTDSQINFGSKFPVVDAKQRTTPFVLPK